MLSARELSSSRMMCLKCLNVLSFTHPSVKKSDRRPTGPLTLYSVARWTVGDGEWLLALMPRRDDVMTDDVQ